MSEYASTNITPPKTTEPPSPAPPQETESTESNVAILPASEFSVDSYADRLMDELFQDLEQSLDRGALPTEPAHPQPVAATSASPLSHLLLSSLLSRWDVEELDLVPSEESTLAIAAEHGLDQPLETQGDREQADVEADFFGTPADASLTSASDETNRWGIGKSLDRLLLVLVCASLAVTGLLWFVLRQSGVGLLAPVAIAPASDSETMATVPATPEDAEFLDYVQRSLNAIDRRATTNSPLTAAANPPTGDLPTVSIPGSPTAGNGTNPERVYIPVYQAPQVSAANPPAVATTPTPSTDTATAPSPPATVPNIAPSTNHVLVGLLELGERSAALFEVNGTVQRIYVGESIGSSGWALVSVSNEEAIVRRNGDVRSIYIGQRF